MRLTLDFYFIIILNTVRRVIKYKTLFGLNL